MPGWLTWTLVGLGIWFAVSVVSAFVVGHLLSHQPAPRRAVS
jgi:fatty acid desaturase